MCRRQMGEKGINDMAKTKSTAAAEIEDFEEIEDMNEEREPGVPTEAEKKTAINDLNRKVPFMAFKDNDKYKDDLIVIVNGKTWQIQRGKTVMIPKFVYLAIKQADRQNAHSADHNERLSDQYRKLEGRLNY